MNPRIIAGSAKNRKLLVPDTSRPVTDRIKQSVFDLLGERVVAAEVLDLYAGSGSFGIECLSRGAQALIFVEQDELAVNLLRQNLQTTGFAEQSAVFQQNVLSFIHEQKQSFDLIFCDPPFATAESFPLQELAKLLKPSGLVVFRKPTNANLPTHTGLDIAYTQKYGESAVFFLQNGLTG